MLDHDGAAPDAVDVEGALRAVGRCAPRVESAADEGGAYAAVARSPAALLLRRAHARPDQQAAVGDARAHLGERVRLVVGEDAGQRRVVGARLDGGVAEGRAPIYFIDLLAHGGADGAARDGQARQAPAIDDDDPHDRVENDAQDHHVVDGAESPRADHHRLARLVAERVIPVDARAPLCHALHTCSGTTYSSQQSTLSCTI
mmetsp:Transcript_27461/g.64089  ORF Transcript_27461/g.64089 Transcript_27461/m.64089 type:complete len:202 (+) Transcript_27461:1884-2489(+)